MIFYVIVLFWLVLFRSFTKQTRLVGSSKILIDSMSLNFIDNVVIQIKDIEVNRLFYGRQINISQAKISLIQLNFSRCTQCQIIRSSPHKIRRWKSVVVSSIQESRCITGCYLPGAVHGGGGLDYLKSPYGAPRSYYLLYYLFFHLLSVLLSIFVSIIRYLIYYLFLTLISISPYPSSIL